MTYEFELTHEQEWKIFKALEKQGLLADLDLYMVSTFDDNEEERPELTDDQKNRIIENYLSIRDNNWFEHMDAAFESVVRNG